MTGRWEFWIDRGGTFTDIVARRPDNKLVTRKLLSQNPAVYEDAAIQGIRDLLAVDNNSPLPTNRIGSVKIGTTVATNALLERSGEQTLLVTTQGFGDTLRIGYQSRPDLFVLDIVLPEMLFSSVIEVNERVRSDGSVLTALAAEPIQEALSDAYHHGFKAVAVVLMHSYLNPTHELAIGAIAAEIGFPQISLSHKVNPLIKYVPRGDTTVLDAYLSPVLRSYVNQISNDLGETAPVAFMQSNGGLTDSELFDGKDALLSGPAGGVVGMVQVAQGAGFEQLIGFDMGGTSTDVSHYAGELERTDEGLIAGIRIRTPMISVHTIAAGGSSILHFDGARLRVGPDSAGAYPGPACYKHGGPLTLTDCNVVLGKLRPEFFPQVFGASGSESLCADTPLKKFRELADEVERSTGSPTTAEQLAEGFLTVAINNMANAIKKISTMRGHDVGTYTLVCFGSAAGQHACLVADHLGISQIYIHPLAGVLSALGIGLADARNVVDQTVENPFSEIALKKINWSLLEAKAIAGLAQPADSHNNIELVRRMSLRYAGSDSTMQVPAGDLEQVSATFAATHRAQFGFESPEKRLIIASVQVEAVARSHTVMSDFAVNPAYGKPLNEAFAVTTAEGTSNARFMNRAAMDPGKPVTGPAVLIEPTTTIVVEPGWQVSTRSTGELVMDRISPTHAPVIDTEVNPVQLEIFNNLFMSIAEQMGVVLQSTASSINIKERLDFSCAVFDPDGDLIANAPHIPVHLGSMSESIKATIASNPHMNPGDAYVMNTPYNGGTHLPDVTVVKPVFKNPGSTQPMFYVAARGHHADIGGIVPGSFPANSSNINEEGILLDNVKLVENGRFREGELRQLLAESSHPARNVDQNIADLIAQVAACEKGSEELRHLATSYGLSVVHAYMGHVKDNAEESVRQVIDSISDSSFSCETDDDHQVSVRISVDRANRSAMIDFTGTSAIHPGNYNAPAAVCQAAVLYVFRCLVDDEIPLNAGCMRPLDLKLPEQCMINPISPAAVVAGNVETSQLIVDTLFGALGVSAAAQGTMNNFAWGNEKHQYYETICGGAGATANADGCDAVHTHMTNSRLTDPEILESRFPVLVEEFSIRANSGGTGVNRGGNGVLRRIRFEEDMEVNILSSRRTISPYGIYGGNPGARGINRVIRRDKPAQALPGKAHLHVMAGDAIEILTPGGGGFGYSDLG